ncbi:hypothetical protein ACH42_04345 [Endozoicomonas sp. (ex Bugula neritina AB1)]|nr:hypothetical protein ACH42_04345 [Endozoicomonas sp. (ex Bugula neritina AB1)]
MYISQMNCPNFRVLGDFRKNNLSFFHDSLNNPSNRQWSSNWHLLGISVWAVQNSRLTIVRWNDKKQKWVFILTNLNWVEFTLSEVLQAYHLRWQIEPIFKEIKSYSGWNRFNCQSATLVCSLILMSFVIVTLKRYLAHAAQANLFGSGAIKEISTHKVMESGTSLFGNVIKSLMDAGKSLLSCIKKLLAFWEKCKTESSRTEWLFRAYQTGLVLSG